MKLKSIKIMMAGLLIITTMAFSVGLITPISVSAANTDTIQGGANAAQGTQTPTNLFTGKDPVFKAIVNVALFIIGAVSVLMLIYGGIKYTTSAGDEKAVTAAKNTIMYAVVGIVIAILAYAIVNFVISALIP